VRIVSNIFCTEKTRFTNPSLSSSGLGFQDSTKVPLRPEFNSFLNPKPLPSLPYASERKIANPQPMHASVEVQLQFQIPNFRSLLSYVNIGIAFGVGVALSQRFYLRQRWR